MAFFDKSKKRSSEGRSSYGNTNSASNKVLTRTNCSSCGDSCQVPFKPLPGKTVLCNNCFRTKDSNAKSNDRPHPSARYADTDKRKSYNSESVSSNNDLSEINAKLDRILKILES